MSDKRVKQPDVTRRKVMTAAVRVFRVHGYQGASLNEIVAESGVTKGAFFHHFKSKKDIALAMLDDIEAKRIRKEWIDPIGDGDDVVDAITSMIEQRRLEAEKKPSLLAIGSTLWSMATEMASLDSSFQHEAQKVYTEWGSAWEASFRRAEAEGRLSPQPDWSTFTWWLIESIESALTAARFHGDLSRLGFAFQQIVNQLARLRKASPGAKSEVPLESPATPTEASHAFHTTDLQSDALPDTAETQDAPDNISPSPSDTERSSQTSVETSVTPAKQAGNMPGLPKGRTAAPKHDMAQLELL